MTKEILNSIYNHSSGIYDSWLIAMDETMGRVAGWGRTKAEAWAHAEADYRPTRKEMMNGKAGLRSHFIAKPCMREDLEYMDKTPINYYWLKKT